ncbi:SRPBCC family protein [Methylocystis parvus]|uniref:SRPBCC family protein n=1 Tax=Methylocystis parvus TaxID=134 RepID=A0A6B8M5G1_9HYPH|nr:SRPBCC family protein [Methylocystis parvus]QGM97009.1 SRPBCC family protein [Methylocystis parvus]WBJ99096.1 SRPBCC family protein [Methylocystis parvus OBBP]
MKTSVTIRKSDTVDADAAWAAIRGVDGLDRWFPIIDRCRVEGAGVGAVRIFTIAHDGGEVRDRILEIDEAARRLKYDRFSSPFPVSSYIGTVEIRTIGDKTELIWTVEFESAEAARDDVAALVKSAISDGVDGLFRELRAKA